MVTLACAGFLCGSLQAATAYFQMNLASAISELAAHQNPWGMSFSSTSPFWVSNQGSNDSTLYNAAGVPQGGPLIVSTPASPTGQVFNVTPSFLVGGVKATFLFDSLSGQIAGWNTGSTAVTEFSATDGAMFTGLAIG